PLDELLLQLAESLKKTMDLDRAEVWTRSGGVIERAVSVPDRGNAELPIATEEETVIARAGVSGPAWIRVWLPALLPHDDPETDPQEAVQALRNPAHATSPPLLMDRGLPDALRAAGDRAALPTTVEAEDVGRYPQQVEAAVYFCCLEALQNAGKHAGEGAAIV